MNGDVPPEFRLDVAREMTDVRRGDDTIRRFPIVATCAARMTLPSSALSSAVGRPPLASFSLEWRRLTHCGGRHRHVFDEGDKCIEPLESQRAVAPQQLSAHFVIGDFRQNDAGSSGNERLKPLSAGLGLR